MPIGGIHEPTSRLPDALDRIRRRHPRHREADDVTLAGVTFRLSDAQLVIACEYGFAHWADLKRRIESSSPAQALAAAIRADDREGAVRLIQLQPQLLHLPLVSGNWGPPMSHAANLGRLEIVQAMASLGARRNRGGLGPDLSREDLGQPGSAGDPGRNVVSHQRKQDSPKRR